MHTYSTTPQPIGTWHNGKTIYEVVFPNINITLTTTWQTLADISSLNVDEMVYVDMLGTYGGNKGSLIAFDAGQIGILNNALVGYRLRANAIAKTIIFQYTTNASS